MSEEATQAVAVWITELEHWRRRLDEHNVPSPPRLPEVVRSMLLDHAARPLGRAARPLGRPSGLAGQPDVPIDPSTMAAMQLLKSVALEIGGRNGKLIFDAMCMLGVRITDVEFKTVNEAALGVLPHTCYLVAFLSRAAVDNEVAGYGVFSEPSPTVSHRYVPAVAYETHGRSYDEAHKEMLENIGYFAARQCGSVWNAIQTWLDEHPRGQNWVDGHPCRPCRPV